MSRKEVKQEKEEHWKKCEGKRSRVIYFDGLDEDGIELMDWKQQELFEKVKSIRNVGAKLEALYKACGKPVPETYRSSSPLITTNQSLDTACAGDMLMDVFSSDTTVASSAVQPQMNYGPDARSETQAAQQSIGHGEGIFEGFSRPRSEASRVTRQSTTTTNLSKVNAALRARDNSAVSGDNRPGDADSGYGSMPQNNGDTDDVFYADGLAAQPGAQCHLPHDVRPYEMSGNDTIAASSGRIMSDHAGHGSFQDYEDASHMLYGAASSSTRDLLGLAIPNLGAENADEPVNIWAFTNLEAEFSEYS